MEKSIIHDAEVYTIHSQDKTLQASFIPEKGGIVSSIQMHLPAGNQEILYQHDFFWEKEWPDLPGGLPFLFPICGRLERDGKIGHYLYDGLLYELPIHGFSWSMPWEVLAFKSDQITMCLVDTPKTHAMYPFAFKVILNYRFEKNQLICEQTYENTGHYALPYYAGFHPYFLTPMPNQGKSDLILDYAPQRRFIYNQKLTDIVGETELFETPISIANPEINEQLTRLGEEKKIRLDYPNNFSITLESKGEKNPHLFNYVQLYTMADKPFFCIEPWMAAPNTLNTIIGAQWLSPGEIEKGFLSISFNSN
jgi:galactose mutarotase-like enzyme